MQCIHINAGWCLLDQKLWKCDNEVIDNTNEKPTNCVAFEIYSIEAIM